MRLRIQRPVDARLKYPRTWLARRRLSRVIFFAVLPALRAQQTYTWQQIKEKFEATNPTLSAARTNVDESRAGEIKAYLRPNPDLSMSLDQIDPFTPNPYRPF